MIKKLIIINGTKGVGKSTICKELLKNMNNSVWLDGDWCWMMNPWNVTDENKKMVENNITFILRNYLKNNTFENILFSWVIHKDEIFDLILDKINDLKYELFKISIICSERELKRRWIQDNRNIDCFDNSLERLQNYYNMNTIKVDTTGKGIINKESKMAAEKAD